MNASARQVQLRRNPAGPVRADDFELVDVALPPLRQDDVLIRNLFMSIDPYMRLMLSSQAGYLAAMRPGEAMHGAAVGVVEESRAPDLPAGTLVLSQMGWRSRFVAPRSDVSVVDGNVPPAWHLGVLGLTGVTAWLGIERVLEPAAGETIFISGAAGAVGSVACQLAKMRGARVLGSAGSAAKAAWLIDAVGVDAALDYNAEAADVFLRREAPEGVDCYFDNVGGTMLETLLDAVKPHGRIGLCGAMSQYQSGDYRSGPRNFFSIIERSLSVTGFNAFLLPPADTVDIVAALRRHAMDGRIMPNAVIAVGLDAAPDAFVSLFDGGFLGKLIVEI